MVEQKLAQGLWRWTAPHPDWRPEKDKPGGWGQMVGCVYAEPPDDIPREERALALIDPLAPPDSSQDAKRFWKALDADVARLGLPVAILLGNFYHQRSAQAVYERYRRSPGAEVFAHEAARAKLTCPLTRSFRPPAAAPGAEGTILPGGVSAFSILGLEECEVAYYLPRHRALVFADALIGSREGEARVAPASWAPGGDEAAERYRTLFRASLRALLDLPVERLLVSHGPPVLADGRAALAAALDAPAWGDS